MFLHSALCFSFLLFMGVYMYMLPGEFCKENVQEKHRDGIKYSAYSFIGVAGLVLAASVYMITAKKVSITLDKYLAGILSMISIILGVIFFVFPTRICQDGYKDKHARPLQISSYVFMGVGALTSAGVMYMTFRK